MNRPLHPADKLPVLGTADQWSRDYSLLGAILGAGAPLVMWSIPALGLGLSLAGAIVGAVTGAAFGRARRAGLDRLRGRLPLPLVALAVPAAAGLWGALSGSIAGALMGGLMEGARGLFAGALLTGSAGALAAALVVGLVWFPLAFQSVTRGARWPVLAAAAVLSPLAPLAGWALTQTTPMIF